MGDTRYINGQKLQRDINPLTADDWYISHLIGRFWRRKIVKNTIEILEKGQNLLPNGNGNGNKLCI